MLLLVARKNVGPRVHRQLRSFTTSHRCSRLVKHGPALGMRGSAAWPAAFAPFLCRTRETTPQMWSPRRCETRLPHHQREHRCSSHHEVRCHSGKCEDQRRAQVSDAAPCRESARRWRWPAHNRRGGGSKIKAVADCELKAAVIASPVYSTSRKGKRITNSSLLVESLAYKIWGEMSDKEK